MIWYGARKLVAVVVASSAMGLVGQAACGTGLKTLDEINNPADDKALHDCRELGRAAVDAGKSPEEAWEIYDRCTKDAGF